MHSSNSKVRNSPSANIQSSPKSKQEVMVRPPTVMSPSSNPQLDSKFSSQGKQGSTISQSQLSPCEPKSSNHTLKALPSSASNMGLKNGAGNGAKSKGKRECSISVDSFDQRDVGTPSTDSEIKDCTSIDTVLSQDSQHASLSMTPSSAPRSSTPSHGSTLMPDTAAAQKATSKVVYVFSTEMANKAAEAVINGQAESIVLFHIQSTSNSKAEGTSSSVNAQLSATRNDPKPQPQPPVPQEQTHSQTTMLQSDPAATSKAIASCCPLSQNSAEMESKVGTPYSPTSTTLLTVEASLQSTSPTNQAASPLPQDNTLPEDPKVELKSSSNSSRQTSSRNASSLGDSVGGLSQEQLEHRERSLQTLRDIQRMLFPDEKEFALKDNTGQVAGSQKNSGLLDGPQKKPEGPVQAMISQSQSISKGPGPQSEGGISFGPPGQREIPFSPEDMVVPPMNSEPGPNGQNHLDHMTPEQVAWLKLQQEFYEEKRRKQEQTVVQQRSLQDMMVHQHGPRGMVRGPPPPYQMNSGESWGPGGLGAFSNGMNIPHSLPSKGIAPHPNMPGSQVSRLPTFVGMMNPDIEVHSVPNTTCRPGISGVGWPEEISKISDGRNFSSGQGIYSGPGRGERLSNSRGLPEEIFQQQISEKQIGMGMESNRTGVELNRPVMPQRYMEPGGGVFPRMPGDGPLSPSRAEFHKGMHPQLVPSREVEFGLSPRNMNMKVDMNVSISLNSTPQLMTQKIREAGMGPEEMMKIRSGSSEMLTPPQKMILSSQFSEHPQQEYGMNSRPCIPMTQSPGEALRHSQEQIGPDQRTNIRLSHMPPLPLNSTSNPNNLSAVPPLQRNLGRKPLDNVSAATSQVNSPSVNPLKSPTMRQVQSPMLGSPSGNLKSPQTPSQLAGILTAPTVVSASIKSPPVLGSAAASPVHLKSPSLPVPSPGWTSSPKPPMQSPGIPPSSHKPPLGITSPAMMGNDPGGPPTPTSSQPASVNLPGSLPSNSSYTMPAEPTLSQNPLSIMMSRMSKFAMPSSTPLYHDAIKTVASSDDDSPPARSPNLPSMNHPGTAMNSQNPPRLPGPHPVAPMPTLSPVGMGQTLSHTNQISCPNTMGPNLPSHGAPIGSGMLPHNPMMIHSSQEPSMVPQRRMSFSQGFPPVPSPPHQVPFPHSGPSGGHGSFPTGISFPGDGPLTRPNNLPQSSTDPALCKPGGPVGPDSYIMGNNMPSVFTDPDLQEVIRPGASGIPEFDLSRIIPSEKPSQTLQYFPRGEVQGRKQPSGPGPGFSHIPGVMAEQNTRMGVPIPGMGGLGPVATSDIHLAAPSMPGHSPMRLPTFMQQGLISSHHRMISTAQTGLPNQPAIIGNTATVSVMAGKERVPAGLYNHPGPMGSPNMLMSMQGMMGPQQNLVILPQMRPRSMAADMGMGGFSQGAGNPANMF